MPDIDPRLQVALLQWQAELRGVDESGGTAAEAERIRSRRIRVFIESELDDAALEALGLRLSSRIGRLVIAELALEDAERVARSPAITALALDQPLKTQLDGSVPQIRAPEVWNAPTGHKGRNVVLGIIDTGVDIFHDSFRKADRSKSRILAIWDQRATGGPTPSGFGYGVEYLQAQIETALATDVAAPGTATFPHTDGEVVGGVRVETGGHGTHVLGTAAGDGSPQDTCDWPFTFIGVAPEADLVVVRSGGRTTFLVEALQYIFSKAAAMSPPRPAVVNISLGWNLGARDGTDPMDVGIDGLLAPGGVGVPGRAVVVSAGNEGETHRHARKTVVAKGEVRFQFEILAFQASPRDTSDDILEIWFDGAATLSLRVDGPSANGTVSQLFPAAGGTFKISGNDVTTSSAAVMPNGQKMIHIRIAGSAETPVAKGLWTLRLTETADAAATVDVWVERDDRDVYPRFVDADNVRENTITLPGTCRSVITVGSYNPDRFLGIGNFGLSSFSSWGLPMGSLPPGRRLKPDIAAPGEAIMAAASGKARRPPPCCACCNYLHVDMQGTSMAAPHVAGVAALIFERNPTLTCEQVRAHIQLGASRDSLPADEVPGVLPLDRGGGSIGTSGQPDFLEIHQNHIWGSGRLDAKAAIATVLAPPGGGGGGGGGGPMAPVFRLAQEAAPRSPMRAAGHAGWPAETTRRPSFQLFAALVSTHIDEVRRLIDGNRRIAVVWRRGGGPAILRHLLERPRNAGLLLPTEVDGFPVQSLLDRLMAVLARFGSEALRADVARWGGFVRAAPGADFDALDARIGGGIA